MNREQDQESRIQNIVNFGERDREYFERVCFQNEINLSEIQLQKLDRYVSLLLEWNSKINLISRKDEHDVWRNHILHSVAVMTQHNFIANEKYFDLGTGGGLPGIPLAIMNPDSEFVLCDSIQKKIKAIDEILSDLSLHNVNTIASRAEDLGKNNKYKNQYSSVLARAVSRLGDLVKFSQHLLHPGKEKLLIAWKGGDIPEEIRQVKKLNVVESIEIRPINLINERYFEDQQKHLVYVRIR